MGEVTNKKFRIKMNENVQRLKNKASEQLQSIEIFLFQTFFTFNECLQLANSITQFQSRFAV